MIVGVDPLEALRGIPLKLLVSRDTLLVHLIFFAVQNSPILCD